jgi:hypothetical protein
MRARVFVGFSICFAAAAFGPWACIPHPEEDFENYQERIANLPKLGVEASTFEASAPPAEAVKSLYYGACLSELAFKQASKVFNFYTNTEFTPSPGGGGTLVLSIQALKIKSGSFPPDTVTSADIRGGIIKATAAVDAQGRFRLELGTVTVPGECNPISGSDVLIENTTLAGRFAAERFCARLGGDVRQPAASARTLNDTNICQFIPVNDGDKRPELVYADLAPDSCPP